ncbi:pentatricopeptide repeat-containing protein At1g74630-like [Ananas comosus]|uniref:Pentatricopeptide repeat-containing protein At1g74630-like n=1 Tax=Ananas comosus TaxID=4615 RepID=A0A6P5G603_ANACO|nr:pentatricopeptide repeat-containing protein At1g74630-like [Ananas comosus]
MATPTPHLLLRRSSAPFHLAQAHAALLKAGLAHRRRFLSKLVSLLALSPHGSLPHARDLFDSAPPRLQSPPLFAALIRAYACGRAFAESPLPDFPRKGAELHCRVVHLGFAYDPFVQNSLIFMYSKCSNLHDARKVFGEMAEKTLVSWNAMIAAYDRSGDRAAAERLFREMPERNVTSWNSMIARHVRAGDTRAAQMLFDEMPERDAISWNSMIAVYIRAKNHKRALELFRQMQANNIKPTELTLVSVLGACAETGGLEIGKEIHNYLENNHITIDGYVGNALIDMYSKCGSLKLARKVFDEMPMKHVTCWNSMITGLAVHGHCEEAFDLFASMVRELNGVAEPNRVTFLAVLIACTHKGLVKEGQIYFDRMVNEYKIEPDIKHYGCMVDLLSRCGMVEEAYQMIKEMPVKANSVMWKTVLAACRVHGNVELGEKAFKELLEMDSMGDDVVTMSNIYAETGRWGDVKRLRSRVTGCNIWKQAACSQIELLH